MNAAEGFGPVDPAEAAELTRRRRERRAHERRNDHAPPWGADDGRPLATDHRRRAAEVRQDERVLQAAYDEGVAGVCLDEGAWPPELLGSVCDAHAAGLDEYRTRRREARWARVRSALCWLARYLAPRTARRVRRLRRRVRRVRAVTGGAFR